MLNVKTWALTLSTFCAVSYVLCIAWCAVAPEGWHAREFLELMLPGFIWLSPGSFVLGLLESIGLGAYTGALLAAIHNWIG